MDSSRVNYWNSQYGPEIAFFEFSDISFKVLQENLHFVLAKKIKKNEVGTLKSFKIFSEGFSYSFEKTKHLKNIVKYEKIETRVAKGNVGFF